MVRCRRGTRAKQRPRQERGPCLRSGVRCTFGVFVSTHSLSGWRYDGAATSNNDLSVIQEDRRALPSAASSTFCSCPTFVILSGTILICAGSSLSLLIWRLSASTAQLGLGATCRPASRHPYTSPELAPIGPTSPRALPVNELGGQGRALNFSRSLKSHMVSTTCATSATQEFVDVVRASGTAGRRRAPPPSAIVILTRRPESTIDPSKVSCPLRPSRPVLM